MFQLIPLSPLPNQKLVLSLNVDGKVEELFITLRYNEIAAYWVMTVEQPVNNVILDSIPLVTGEIPAKNILSQFAYLGIGSAQVINASQVSSPNYPNDTDLGTDFVLVWGDTPSA